MTAIDERHIRCDKASGKDFNRREWNALIGTKESAPLLREGDLLVVLSLDRLGRNYTEVAFVLLRGLEVGEQLQEGSVVRCAFTFAAFCDFNSNAILSVYFGFACVYLCHSQTTPYRFNYSGKRFFCKGSHDFRCENSHDFAVKV